MTALDIVGIKAEMHKLAKENLQPWRKNKLANEIKRDLEKLHAPELEDTVQVLVVYYMYRELLRDEGAKEQPRYADRLRYAIAMNLFASTYVRLLS